MREKGDKAREMKGKLQNAEFMLLLSGLTDIYMQFGVIVQATQMVHLLPHERIDKFDCSVTKLKSMKKSLNSHHETCPSNCHVSQYHSARKCLLGD